MRRQTTKVKRHKLSATTYYKINREVARLAAQFDCSMSFVIATALADQFGIDLEERSFPKATKRRRAA